MLSTDSQTAKLRAAIRTFIKERFDAKTEKLTPDDPKYQALVEQFDYDTWLADAARRVSQLQVVTHSLKPTHPDAKGSSIYAPPGSELPENVIATDTLDESFNVDVVGNAAALDVFKFLKLEIDGHSLLERVEQTDSALAAAFSDDTEKGQQLLQQFAAITEPGEPYRSHTRAKQLYWLAGDEPSRNDHYHLLSPLYATTLAHAIHLTIQQDRFSDEAKAASEARRKKQSHTESYCEYPGLAIQRFGGSKPQNISQLNSERGGNSYLLSCAPPQWHSRAVSAIRSDSAFYAFGRRPNVRVTIRELAQFLATHPPRNMATRDYRDQLTAEIIDELIVFTTEMHQLAPGWTDDWYCRLPFEQQCWLDPYRAHDDSEFARDLIETDWLSDIGVDFSRWLTNRLEYHWKYQRKKQHKEMSTLGDPEFHHFRRSAAQDNNMQFAFGDTYKQWQEELGKELAALEEVLNHSEVAEHANE